MNTKEAIEFCKSQKCSIKEIKENYYIRDGDKGYMRTFTSNKEFGEIIDLLKRGEKYEQMWKHNG